MSIRLFCIHCIESILSFQLGICDSSILFERQITRKYLVLPTRKKFCEIRIVIFSKILIFILNVSGSENSDECNLSKAVLNKFKIDSLLISLKFFIGLYFILHAAFTLQRQVDGMLDYKGRALCLE